MRKVLHQPLHQQFIGKIQINRMQSSILSGNNSSSRVISPLRWVSPNYPTKQRINYGMKILTRNLPQYQNMFDQYITPIEGDVNNISKQLIELINSDKT